MKDQVRDEITQKIADFATDNRNFGVIILYKGKVLSLKRRNVFKSRADAISSLVNALPNFIKGYRYSTIKHLEELGELEIRKLQ